MWCTVTKVHTGHDDKTLERLQVWASDDLMIVVSWDVMLCIVMWKYHNLKEMFIYPLTQLFYELLTQMAIWPLVYISVMLRFSDLIGNSFWPPCTFGTHLEVYIVLCVVTPQKTNSNVVRGGPAFCNKICLQLRDTLKMVASCFVRHWCPSNIHGITTQKTKIWILIALKFLYFCDIIFV
jgi:hypothetical protein